VPDCDAVYAAHPEEIVDYGKTGGDLRGSDVFHRNGCTFGLMLVKL
jgi:hypothetical protein